MVTSLKINSRLSLQPLVTVLRKMISEGKPGARRLYQQLIDEVEAHPALLKPIDEICTLENERELVETLLSTIFPPATSSNQGLYAITFPFSSETAFASPGFAELLLEENTAKLSLHDPKTDIELERALAGLAYNLIFKQLYLDQTLFAGSAVYPIKDETGLTRYYELKFNSQFITVRNINKNFTLPKDPGNQQAVDLDELMRIVPLENFLFEGLMVIEATDVTQDQVNTEIKNALLRIDAFSEVSVSDELQQRMQSLLGLRNVQIGITPFFKMNGYSIYTESLYKNSLLFKSADAIMNRDQINELCKEVFRDSSQPLHYEILNEASTVTNKLLVYYRDQGAKSLFLCPLKTDEGKMIGLLEVMSTRPGELQLLHLTKITPALPLFTLALEKSEENLEMQTDKMIKEHFTAIQPSVEWKFTEAAFNYLQYRQVSDVAQMPPISFENVYPLYAAIDIRNSSTERNHAIQLDLLEQLNMARDVVAKASKVIYFPLLKEMEYQIDKYINAVSDTLLSDDELQIYDFLQNDFDAMFFNLALTKPELKKIIENYQQALDPHRKLIYRHRKNYEESITRINDVLDRFIDSEQRDAQEIYPHYFERYVTDGIEFNIYIGQSLSPNHLFNEMYVRNLKLWQLTLLAKAARISHTLEKRLTLPLKTTQLILAHSIPLSISFRRKERKFDVDGAYNIRYEIIKKRIDKVHLKDSDERLTQPEKIAIVYSQHRELEEYLEFIDFLQHENLLGDDVEHLELEETQGISGLKAIRVNIILNEPVPPKVELSKTTSQQLLRR